MNIFHRIAALFAKPDPREGVKREYDEACTAYNTARVAYMARVDRGDDRGAGERWRPYFRAKCDLLRAETNLRRSA